MKPFHFILAMGAAAAAGVVAGVLFAPRKGKESRENLADFVESHHPILKNRRLEALAQQIANEIRR